MPNGADAPGAGPGGLIVTAGILLGGFLGRKTSRVLGTPAEESRRTQLVALEEQIGALAAASGEAGVGDPQTVLRLRREQQRIRELPFPEAFLPPPLVTERFETLPPFVPQPDLPVLQELGIPFMEEFPQPQFFQPRPIPEPDVLEEDMAVDSPLLAGFGSLLPAVRGVATPTVSGFIGGLAQDVLSGFLRAPQELGMAQVPARRAGTQIAPAEKPSTRILRQIQASTGVRVKLSSAKALIRQLGLQNGARCLGISVTDACTLIITSSPRRRRGISGSDIRIVKRTARRFQSLQEDLSGLVSRRRAAPRRRRGHVHAIQHTAPGG